MTMLICGGLLHTMTEQGSYVGDVLIRGDCVEMVAPRIELPEDCHVCMLNAHGFTILPGMIDLHIHDGPETDENILSNQHAAGITAGLIWPETEGACIQLMSDASIPSHIYAIQPDTYTDAQLHERFLSLADEGRLPACEITNASMCRRVLQTVYSTGVKAILSGCCGCEEMLESIALSGCPVVLSVSGVSACRPWTMAARLESLGAAVSLSCGYPFSKLCRLPLCAALCARVGMDRESVLKMITSAPAGILRVSGAGCIKAGGRADFAIYDGDPLLLASNHVMTICGGKIRH